MPWRAALWWWLWWWAVASAWDLRGLVPADSVRHITIWRNRAFLCAERRDPKQEGTLVEAPWPEPGCAPAAPAWSRPRAVRLFPARQPVGDCERPQSAVATAAEPRGRLWLLDAAAHGCHPKIAIYDLISLHNQQLLVCELQDAGAVSGLAVDGGVGGAGPRAYVSVWGRSYLVVFAQRERRWWLLHVEAPEVGPGPGPPPLPCQHVALGRTARDTALFLTADNSSLLCTLSLQKLRAQPPPPVADSRPAEIRVQAQCPGSKLGPSACLAADPRGGALYFLSRDGAAVRWDSRQPLSAESHAVLLPPAPMATPRQLFLVQGRLWALTPPTADSKHCSLVSRSLPSLPPLLPKKTLPLKPHQ